jgi:hypothetical protein
MPVRQEMSLPTEISDAKEFSVSIQDPNLEGGGPCVGAPCNPGPGGPPPRCAPQPPQPRCGRAEAKI